MYTLRGKMNSVLSFTTRIEYSKQIIYHGINLSINYSDQGGINGKRKDMRITKSIVIVHLLIGIIYVQLIFNLI